MSRTYYGPRIVRDGLVLYLDAANPKSFTSTSDPWKDLSGNGNHGDFVNGPTYNSNNLGSISFDGTDDCVTVDSNNPVYPAWTIEAWIYRSDWSATSGRDDWVTAGEDESSAPLNFDYNDGQITHYRGAAGGEVLSYFYNVNESAYHHVCVVQKNIDSTTKEIYLYFDGQQKDSDTGDFEDLQMDRYFNIGSDYDNGTRYYYGKISVVRVYNKALTQDEIIQNYEATKGKYNL